MTDPNWCADGTITAHEEVLNSLLLERGFLFSRQFQVVRADSDNSYWLDFAWPDSKFAIEIDGHPVNLEREYYLSRLGWRILHLQNEHFHTRKEAARSFSYIEELIKANLNYSCSTPPRLAPLTILERAARELLACAMADKAVAAKVRSELPVGRYPSEVLRKIAAVAYEQFERTGEISRRELVALLQDAATMEVAAAIVDLEIEPARAPDRAAGCMLTLGVAEANRAYREIQGRLDDKSDEEQRAALRAFMETKGAKTRVNPKAFPGR